MVTRVGCVFVLCLPFIRDVNRSMVSCQYAYNVQGGNQLIKESRIMPRRSVGTFSVARTPLLWLELLIKPFDVVFKSRKAICGNYQQVITKCWIMSLFSLSTLIIITDNDMTISVELVRSASTGM